MNKYIFVCAFFIWFVNGCSAQNCSVTISDNFFDEDVKQEKNIFSCVLQKGVSIIPHLLDFIDLHDKCRVGFSNPASSLFSEISENNFKGIKAAYLIETLIHTSAKNHLGFAEMKLFGYCVIVRVKNGEPVMEPMTSEDMSLIKQIYTSWWLKNQNKSLEDIRMENFNILNGSNYMWI